MPTDSFDYVNFLKWATDYISKHADTKDLSDCEKQTVEKQPAINHTESVTAKPNCIKDTTSLRQKFCGAVNKSSSVNPSKATQPSAVKSEAPKEATPQPDIVNRPPHYTFGKIECIDACESAVAKCDGFEGAMVFNVIKYLWRHKLKAKPIEDLKKACFYLNRLISYEEAKLLDGSNHSY